MKLIYLTSQLYLHGGIEKMLAQKINYWLEVYGYEVILCTTEQMNNPFVYYIDNRVKHIDLGINYDRNKSYFHPKNLWKSVKHYFSLRKMLEWEQPTVVISANYTPEQFLLPFMAKHFRTVKEFHSSGVTITKPKSLLEKMKHRLFLLFKRYDALVVLNEDECKYYPFTKLHVIPNFLAKRQKERSVVKEKIIIAAGRIAPVKQFEHLIHAWSLIAAKHPDWVVKIFGDGDVTLTSQLNQQIQESKISNIHLMGATEHLNQEMMKASLFAMTSATECFPMVLLEAQAAGLCIISYDCPNGPRHIVHHKIDGLLTPTNEIAIFADNLTWLLENEEVRTSMGENAKLGVETYSQASIMELWNTLFKKLNFQDKNV
jgi:glycosyltransferase involved in cell wall biosynthesis